MKQKQLELILQQIPPPPNPKPELEQYQTPASIAADMLYLALAHGDIANKKVIDLGCGTGMFSIGAALLGAQKTLGVDSDQTSIDIAQDFAKKHNLSTEFITQDISTVDISCDTVLMNPPFGAQKSNEKADRAFLVKAYEIGDVVYSLHLAKTLPFLQTLISAIGGKLDIQKQYDFPIPRMFSFHQDMKRTFDVILLRITHEHGTK